jgi:ABC-type amino acid transport substrate-binding protein
MGKDNYRYELIQHTFDERMNLIGQGDVDIGLHFTARTMDRDVHKTDLGTGLSFSVPYLYFTTAFGGDPKYVACAENGLQTTGECADMKICVTNGTLIYDLLALQLPKTYLVETSISAEIFNAFVDGKCNVILGASVQLNVLLYIMDMVFASTGVNFVIGQDTFTKEPCSIVTRDDDAVFSDFVNWVMEGLFAAEQQGITKENILSEDSSILPSAKFRHPRVFGDQYKDMFYNAIAAVGNYGEILQRQVHPEVFPRDHMNFINNGTTGLIHAAKLGQTESYGPPPQTDGTLMVIKRRGKLRCGIRTRNRPGFAQEVSYNFNSGGSSSSSSSGLKFEGMDVDYCSAIAAAIYARSPWESIEFFELRTVEDGFLMLQSGDLDIVAGVMKNLDRDVREPTTDAPFSFTNPYFYNHTSASSEGRYVKFQMDVHY